MTHRFLAFDIEVAAIVPEGETGWKAHRPLGITCAAIAYQLSDGHIVIEYWHGGMFDDRPAPRMSMPECGLIVYALMSAVNDGYTLLTWNGLGFDFDILAEESGLHAECCELARNHVDMMFHFFCVQGFPVSLNAVAKGLGLAGKTEGVNGADAPRLWANGEYDKVLEYVQQDVRTTLEVALAIEQRRRFSWITKRGRLSTLPVERLLTVQEALTLPEPDVSWMTEPKRRDEFLRWMEQEQPS